MRRSSRKGIGESKRRAKAAVDYLAAPDHKVLSGALPSPYEKVPKQALDKAAARLKPELRVSLALQRGKRQNPLTSFEIGPMTRHILFMNVGDERIMEAIQHFTRGTERPAWTRNIRNLSARNGTLYLTENGRTLPFALQQEKRNAVKKMYFDPKKPATIQPIADALRHEFCNISRKNVRNILRSLETYQLMYPRRRHPKIEHHTLYTKPGVIAMDSFFPSANSGWVIRNVLVCMDVWSRFSRAYAIEKREAAFYRKAMGAFFAEIVSLGVMPRRLLTDKGSELHVGTELMEKFRLPRDGKNPMHLRSFTGTPVMVVENLNAQYQRRLEPYRIAELQDDPADLLWDISEQLNNQRRPRKGNHTPYELLRMAAPERNALNAQYNDSYTGVGVDAQKKLPLLKVGDHVRKLEMTYKEQVENKRKAFQEKWSRTVYQVLRITKLRRNKHIMRYSIGDPKRSYFRHELLLIPKDTDQEVLRFPTSAPLLVQGSWRPQ
mgnify:CR=1 FL=1